MSEFLSYNPELDEASFSSETKPFLHDKNSPETQIPVPLEQVIELANKIPEIKEFLAQQNLSPEELTDLYQALQKTIKDDLALINLDLVKKISSDILGSVSSSRENRPFHQKALSLVTATLLAFLGPVAFKNRSASAVAQSKTSVTTTDSTSAAVLAEESAAQTSPEPIPTVSFADFKFDKVNSSFTDVTKDAFNEELKKIKHPDSYTDQFQAIVQMIEWTVRPVAFSLTDSISWRVVIYNEEIARLKEFIENTKPSKKNASKIARVTWDILYFYNNTIYQSLFPQLGDMSKALNADNTEEQTFDLETLDAEHLTPESLNWLNGQIDLIRNILSFSQNNVSDWDTAMETSTNLIKLLEIRNDFFMNYFRERVAFPDYVSYPVPTWKLGN